jgi:hypothetical protein
MKERHSGIEASYFTYIAAAFAELQPLECHYPTTANRMNRKCLRASRSFSCVDHRYNDKSRIDHKSYTHITQAENTMYMYPALPLFGATLSALLPWLDDCHNNDHHYHQQYDDGIAHPLSRILLQFLGILESANALLYVIGSIRNLEQRKEIDM